jgi:hypothetical protein
MNTSKILSFGLAVGISIVFCGCKTVVRENILSSVNGGIGISVSENPQTEMYEVKLGYFRSQFYSVPTGKLVKGDKAFPNVTPAFSNAAQNTPDVVSGIRVQSSWKQLFLGVDIEESFAVGKEAVNSDAAVAMYVASADTPEKARAAAVAATGMPTQSDFDAATTLDQLAKKPLTSDQTLPSGKIVPKGTAGIDFADAYAGEKFNSTYATVRQSGGPNRDDLAQALQKATK